MQTEKQKEHGLKGFVRLGGSPEEIANKLGPLADLIGTWRGNQGWNLIAVPSRIGPVESFTVLIHQYSEEITFSPITAPVPNRGGLTEQFITGLTYELTVTDMKEPFGVLHIENGMWLNMSDVQDQPNGKVIEGALKTGAKRLNIARMSTIPHGDVVLALGGSMESTGMPDFPVITSLPQHDEVPRTVGYFDQYTKNEFRDKFLASDINKTLRETAAKQTITNVTTITVDTQNKGGSITNIPFVQEFVNPTRFQSTFWIEDVLIDGKTVKQLQYSQQSDLNFIKNREKTADIMWPHVNLNTLVKI